MSSALPNEFWALPDATIDTDALQLIYAEITARLREESIKRGVTGTLEMMMAERIAFLYTWIRDREASGGFEQDRNYKELLQLWNQMAVSFQKTQIVDYESMRDALIQHVAATIQGALEDVDPEVASAVSSKITEAFETAEF